MRMSTKFIFMAMALLICAVGVCSCVKDDDTPEFSLQPGDPVPDFEITLSDGTVWRSRAVRSKPAVIVFFNTGCKDCRRELPAVQEAYDEHRDEAEFVCIAREEDAAAIAQYWEAHGLTLPYSPQTDRCIYNLFANSWIPRIYVVSPEGIITSAYAN